MSQALALIAWLMPDTCRTRPRADHVERKVVRTHACRGGSGAQIAELVAVRPMRDEVDAGGRVGIDPHTARIDALALPQFEEHASEGIVAEARDVRRSRAQARGGDDAVRRVAAESLPVRRRVVAMHLVELEQRLAERDHVESHVGHRQCQRGLSAAKPAA